MDKWISGAAPATRVINRINDAVKTGHDLHTLFPIELTDDDGVKRTYVFYVAKRQNWLRRFLRQLVN